MNQVGEKDCEMDCEMNSCEQSQDVTLFDPPVVVTKGRPESLRKKYALEVAQKTKKISSQKNKKVCSQKIQKVPSQKPKRRTKNMKLNKKETRELDELPYESEEDCVPNDQVGEKYCEMNQVGEKDCEMKSCEQSQDVTLFDPPVVITKGRSESLRKKYALEVAQKAKKVSSQKNKKVFSQKIQKVPS
ncbi:hypothetical protein BC332_11670 [Capsicum chinense]|nr:hypothetical protein BC332_11670 [Capsicum chinense]